jgi:serine/threonine-protein kinase PknG
MSEQLLGVLRSVVGQTDELGHLESAIFDPDSDRELPSGEHRPTDGIPHLKVDKEDKAASLIAAVGAVTDPEKRVAMFARGLAANAGSVELQLRWVDELISLGRFPDAEKRLALVQKEHPTDWRMAWYRGRWLLAQGMIRETLATFESIVNELPGELAPKQALARAHEADGALDRAIEYYDSVSKADPSFVSAAIGLARCHIRRKAYADAAAAFRRVPSTSSRYAFAQTSLVHVLLEETPTADLVLQAAIAVEGLEGMVTGLDLHELRARVFAAAVGVAVRGMHPRDQSQKVLGVRFEEKELRAKAEEELRACAHAAPTDAEKISYVDDANAIRPVTLF